MSHARFTARLLALSFTVLVCLGIGPLAADRLTPAQVTETLTAGIGLAGADLSGDNLAGLTFENLTAAGSTWDRADLRGSIFRGVNLSGASLDGVLLRGAILEQVDLTGARMRGADLTGARLREINLLGADLTGVNLTGAELNDLRMSPAGDRFLPALGLALERLLPPASGPGGDGLVWAAGLSTTAFSFAFDSANFRLWPGTPVTYAPIWVALQTLGIKPQLTYNQGRPDALWALAQALKDKRVVLLPLNLARPGQTGNGLSQPVWAVADRLEGKSRNQVYIFQAPPFGELRLSADQLELCWRGDADTLLTTEQHPARAGYVMYTASRPAPPLTRAQTAAAGVQNAVTTLSDTRARGTRLSGLAGLQQLLSVAKVAVGGEDQARLAQFTQWGEAPRRDLAGARRLGAKFLETTAGLYRPEQALLLQQAAMLYRTEADALTARWGDPTAPPAGSDAATVLKQNVDLLGEATAAEEQALGLLQRVARAGK
ncbi:MAG TPA: pentapeptide repeat-containing protein [Armatimonadota bacterium]|jgi:uncharacterized protein YjbI with pentapeptide repeats